MLTTKEAIKFRAMLLNENRALRKEANRLLQKPAGSTVADKAWAITDKRLRENNKTIVKLEQIVRED